VPLVLLMVLVVALPVPGLGRPGGGGEPAGPERAVITCPVPVAGCRVPGAGVGAGAAAGAALADAVGAGSPQAGGGPGDRGSCSTRMDTVESTRKAMAAAEAIMTGTALLAGCRRKTAPARPRPVLTQSTASASPSCAMGSSGQ
jgi:hypothetical protein